MKKNVNELKKKKERKEGRKARRREEEADRLCQLRIRCDKFKSEAQDVERDVQLT